MSMQECMLVDVLVCVGCVQLQVDYCIMFDGCDLLCLIVFNFISLLLLELCVDEVDMFDLVFDDV